MEITVELRISRGLPIALAPISEVTPERRKTDMHVRITQIGGKLPNLALMTISAYHRKRGDKIYFIRDVKRDLFEPEYGRVYGS
jgi:hypothetical protein